MAMDDMDAVDLLTAACRGTGGNGWFLEHVVEHPAMVELLRRASTTEPLCPVCGRFQFKEALHVAIGCPPCIAQGLHDHKTPGGYVGPWDGAHDFKRWHEVTNDCLGGGCPECESGSEPR